MIERNNANEESGHWLSSPFNDDDDDKEVDEGIEKSSESSSSKIS